VPECTACGACCFNDHYAYVRVFEIDLERMGERARSFTHVVEGQRYMRFENGRCSALALDAERGTVSCTIYAERPDVCHWLVRGSGECRAQIDAKWARREKAMDDPLLFPR
jgi:Fe-S-cluster containining protein